jgi:pimeloyl-ACP methyl ester carboxylesterase
MRLERTVVTKDGARVRYTTVGTGPALVLVNGLATSVSMWKHLVPRWAADHTVLLWDLPGHGASERPMSAAGASIAAQVDTLVRLMDATQLARATLVGFSVGCQIAYELVRLHPERCGAVVALLGPGGRALSSTRLPIVGRALPHVVRRAPPALFASMFGGLMRAASHPLTLRVAREVGLIGKTVSPEDAAELTTQLAALDATTIQRMACSAEEHSAEDVLARMSIPLLIVSGGLDPFAPVEQVGRALHRHVHGSEFVVLSNATHTALLEQPAELAQLVTRFVAQHAERELAEAP